VLSFSPDGRLLAASAKGHLIRLYEVVSGLEVRQFRGHPSGVFALAFSADGHTLASGGGGWEWESSGKSPVVRFGNPEAAVRLWDVPSGKLLRSLPGHQGSVHTLAFLPDGSALLSGAEDDTVLCWDVAEITRRRPTTVDLPEARLASLWEDLASADAARAKQTVGVLSRSPAAGPFLARRLPPATAVRAVRLAGLVADLDHEDFARRERSSQELEQIGEPAAPALRRALEGKPSPEARRRLLRLLEGIDRQESPHWLRAVRALQVLEGIASAEARRVLEGLARGAADAPLTREARAALRRLERRAAIDP
jgi:hypothetical protein